MRFDNTLHRRVVRRTVLAAALTASLGSAAVFAQSNASGVIFGRADPALGNTVHVESVDTGQARDITVAADGRYRASALPVGRYKVTLQKDGQAVQTRDDVQVNVGIGTDVSFASTASTTAAQNLEGVQVIANALPAIDVSSVDSRTVVTAEQLQKLPIAQNVNAAVMLAPGAVQGDARYGNVVSIGGSSAAENQYYLNGYAITNALTGIGAATLPFDGIDQTQVFYGGYGAEYGRSTGGVINVITKRGSNTWKAGAQVMWSPKEWEATPHNIVRKDGTLVTDRSDRQDWETRYGAYISGPLVKDKLFMYASGEFVRSKHSAVTGVSAGAQQDFFDDKATRWLTKLDWNITDNHLLEFTGVGDQGTTDDKTYEYDYPDHIQGGLRGNTRQKNYDGLAGANPGGNIYIGKYTGYITDDLTITGLYGWSKAKHVYSPAAANGEPCPLITDSRASVPPSELLFGCSLTGSQVLVPGAEDRTNGWRLDVEYHLGDHDLRAGVDNQTLKSYSGLVDEGEGRYEYSDRPADGLIRNGLVFVPDGNLYYVDKGLFQTAAKVKVEQEAQYIEDHWQVTDRWLAYIGLRNEQFKNFNGDDQVYVKQRHQLAPRLGVTWDVFGDSSFKLYANAGRYHLAIPSNVAIRAASGSIFSSQFGTFTGIDPVTNVPIGFTPLEPVVFSNGENGVAPDPASVAARDLKAYYQDEYILGFDKTLGPDWAFGAKLTYRKLGSSIDDFCDARPFIAWADRNGVDSSNIGYGCYLFNPGKSNKFTIDLDGDGTKENINLTKADLGYPDLKRRYYSLDMYLEHQFSQDWYGRLDYTFSRSYGNTEGMLKSDIGQTDPSVTQDWDFPELMIGSNGPLPNDRTHVLRARGYWQMTPEWLFGAVFQVVSGRPKNCIGNYPGELPAELTVYGASFFYCDGQLGVRGSKGRLPWTERLDLSVEYRPSFADHKLAFTADIFNVFNQQRGTSMNEIGELGAVGQPNPGYARFLSYQSPRYVQLGARYDFSL